MAVKAGGTTISTLWECRICCRKGRLAFGGFCSFWGKEVRSFWVLSWGRGAFDGLPAPSWFCFFFLFSFRFFHQVGPFLSSSLGRCTPPQLVQQPPSPSSGGRHAFGGHLAPQPSIERAPPSPRVGCSRVCVCVTWRRGSSYGDRPPTAVVMMNLGGPETLSDVRPFLQRLFSDKYLRTESTAQRERGGRERERGSRHPSSLHTQRDRANALPGAVPGEVHGAFHRQEEVCSAAAAAAAAPLAATALGGWAATHWR